MRCAIGHRALTVWNDVCTGMSDENHFFLNSTSPDLLLGFKEEEDDLLLSADQLENGY